MLNGKQKINLKLFILPIISAGWEVRLILQLPLLLLTGEQFTNPFPDVNVDADRFFLCVLDVLLLGIVPFPSYWNL